MNISKGLCPLQDHWELVSELHRKQPITQSILDEMYSIKHDALERIDAFVHPEYARDFISVLSYGIGERIHGAENIARKMGLNQQHFAALDDDTEEFHRLIEKDMFDAIGESRYYDYDGDDQYV